MNCNNENVLQKKTLKTNKRKFNDLKTKTVNKLNQLKLRLKQLQKAFGKNSASSTKLHN